MQNVVGARMGMGVCSPTRKLLPDLQGPPARPETELGVFNDCVVT